MERGFVCWEAIVAKYGEPTNGWATRKPMGAMGCAVWKSIHKGMDLHHRFTRFKINNGETVQFWANRWCTNIPLYVILGVSQLLQPLCIRMALSKII